MQHPLFLTLNKSKNNQKNIETYLLRNLSEWNLILILAHIDHLVLQRLFSVLDPPTQIQGLLVTFYAPGLTSLHNVFDELCVRLPLCLLLQFFGMMSVCVITCRVGSRRGGYQPLHAWSPPPPPPLGVLTTWKQEASLFCCVLKHTGPTWRSVMEHSRANTSAKAQQSYTQLSSSYHRNKKD